MPHSSPGRALAASGCLSVLHPQPTRLPPPPQSDPLTGEVEGVFVTHQVSSDGKLSEPVLT